MWSDHACERADEEMRIAERPWQSSSQMLGCGGWDHKVREGQRITLVGSQVRHSSCGGITRSDKVMNGNCCHNYDIADARGMYQNVTWLFIRRISLICTKLKK